MDVRPLEKTMKVKAQDLPPNVNSDYVTLYFEKYGDIQDDVEMLEDGQSAIITYKDHKGMSLSKYMMCWERLWHYNVCCIVL